jgi:hypothetical protein
MCLPLLQVERLLEVITRALDLLLSQMGFSQEALLSTVSKVLNTELTEFSLGSQVCGNSEAYAWAALCNLLALL